MGLCTFLRFILAAAAAVSHSAYACTTFCVPESAHPVIGKSYDWHQSHGTVLVNPRHLEKRALVLRPDDTPAQWTARYGSLTFNQHGRDFPLGGVNEKGLVVEIMWLDQSVYPAADTRPVVNELQWIQYSLDNFATTREVKDAADTLRVSPAVARVHYLVCDTHTRCATFEYLNGKLVIHDTDSAGVPVLTNNTYGESVRYLDRFTEFGGTDPLPTSLGSLPRFARAAAGVARFSEKDPKERVRGAFAILDNVKVPALPGVVNSTQFQIVYEPADLRVHFRTAAQSGTRSATLSAFDLSCHKPPLGLDMNAPLSGEVSAKFSPFTAADNAALVKRGLRDFESQLPPGVPDKLALYPGTFRCTE